MSNFKMKQCSKCQQSKELSQFYKSSNSSDGLYTYCKACKDNAVNDWCKKNPESAKQHRKDWYDKNIMKRKNKMKEYSKTWQANNPEKAKDKQLKRNYGISLQEYNQLFVEQSGCCGICGKHQTEFKAKLCVDHCHTTGEVRGLLCNSCNVGIGHLKDSDSNLESASRYLNKDQTIILGSEIKLELKLSDSPKSLVNSELANIFLDFV